MQKVELKEHYLRIPTTCIKCMDLPKGVLFHAQSQLTALLTFQPSSPVSLVNLSYPVSSLVTNEVGTVLIKVGRLDSVLKFYVANCYHAFLYDNLIDLRNPIFYLFSLKKITSQSIKRIAYHVQTKPAFCFLEATFSIKKNTYRLRR